MIKTVDLNDMAAQASKRRTVLMDGPKFHAWLTVYHPGEHDEMHCHNADQTFSCVAGECTMYFEDGSKAVLKPGAVALIPGGSFYWLHNAGTETMVLLGTRGLSNAQSVKIDYVTRENIHEGSTEVPRGTRILV